MVGNHYTVNNLGWDGCGTDGLTEAHHVFSFLGAHGRRRPGRSSTDHPHETRVCVLKVPPNKMLSADSNYHISHCRVPRCGPCGCPVCVCVCVCVCVWVCVCGCAEIHVFVVRLHFGSQISQSTCYESKWITVYFKIQMCCFTLNRNAANENWIYLKNDIVSNWSVDWFWYNDLHICRNIFHSFNMWKKRRFHTLLLNLLWMQVSVFSCSFIGLYLV